MHSFAGCSRARMWERLEAATLTTNSPEMSASLVAEDSLILRRKTAVLRGRVSLFVRWQPCVREHQVSRVLNFER